MDAQQLLAQLAGSGDPTQMSAAVRGAGADLIKALEASNYQTDVSQLEGGGALGIQSLDTAMKTVVQEEKHFTLFNRLQRTGATNIVDEYTRQNSIGGWLGGSTNTQMGQVRSAQGEYKREVGFVKFLMTLRQVGYVLNVGNNLAQPMAVEERNGAKQLLTDANYLLYHGNAAASPTQYDGIIKQIEDGVAAGEIAPENIVDMQGTKLDSVEPFSQVGASVGNYGSWGRSSDVFLPMSVQNDLNQGLDPAFRWSPQGNNTPIIGGHVEGIRLQGGILKTAEDTFIHNESHPMVKPFEVTQPVVAASNAAIKPTSIAGVAASDASSQFTSGRAGNYYYAVAAIGANGEGLSAVVKSAQVAIAAGEKVTLTITASGSAAESGYAIYRSRQNGSNATDDLRLVKVIPKTGATTVFVDLNREIPGTVAVPLLNLDQGSDAIGWRQFQPMTKIPLPFGVGGVPVYSWFQFLFGYLRVTKPKHHGLIKNILPANAKWRPHVGE
ncbi:major capsid protein [Pseudomonas phage Dolphis]|nr:major capsid protein [Pseudomonas phage Dolphis]